MLTLMIILSRCSHQPSGRPQDRMSHSRLLGTPSNLSFGYSLPEALPSTSCSSLVEEARPDWIAICPELPGERATFLPCLVSCFDGFPIVGLQWKPWVAQLLGGNILSGPFGLFILLKERHRHITFLSRAWIQALRASFGLEQRFQGLGDSRLVSDGAAFYLDIDLESQFFGGSTSWSEDQSCLRLNRSSLTKPTALQWKRGAPVLVTPN